MSAADRRDAIVRLSGNLQKQTSLFRKQSVETEKVACASYEVSHPCSPNEAIHGRGLHQGIPPRCSGLRLSRAAICLSSRTVRRRIEDMSDNVHDSLKTRSSNFVAFSLALDESTDTKDTAQLAVFIRGVTADLQSLCAKFANLVDVMSVVVKVVNSILSRSLNHRPFQILMDEVNVHYNDLLYLCEVRWLSRGAIVCATYSRRLPPSYVRRIFSTVINTLIRGG
ncbi:general transcription factor II-I repeat domain-containing protein 2-like [Oratosquilla oratoria]|uniref:general transcription factor II-I repeat domain-containing protein 2-like n=1 Tax=Oratosquilla oratoria TaxID=337810 RepID=UPI003F774EF5